MALFRSRAALEVAADELRVDPRRIAATLLAVAMLAALHLASVELVTAAPGQRGQMLLSALWALAGTAAVVAGLRRDIRALRVAGLGLLLATVAKVFVVDLAALDSGWRVGSFLVLGLLLLAGAFAWQRLRPRPAPDLRATPGALRA